LFFLDCVALLLAHSVTHLLVDRVLDSVALLLLNRVALLLVDGGALLIVLR